MEAFTKLVNKGLGAGPQFKVKRIAIKGIGVNRQLLSLEKGQILKKFMNLELGMGNFSELWTLGPRSRLRNSNLY